MKPNKCYLCLIFALSLFAENAQSALIPGQATFANLKHDAAMQRENRTQCIAPLGTVVKIISYPLTPGKPSDGRVFVKAVNSHCMGAHTLLLESDLTAPRANP